MISPHRYAQTARKDLKSSITNECADMIYARIYSEPEMFARIVGNVPVSIPVKYRKKVMEILIIACVNAVCKNTTYPVSMQEKHRILQRALMYSGNVRESAGR